MREKSAPRTRTFRIEQHGEQYQKTNEQKTPNSFQSKIERFLVRTRDNTPPWPGQVKIF